MFEEWPRVMKALGAPARQFWWTEVRTRGRRDEVGEEKARMEET
jgi:hypothetical protein